MPTLNEMFEPNVEAPVVERADGYRLYDEHGNEVTVFSERPTRRKGWQMFWGKFLPKIMVVRHPKQWHRHFLFGGTNLPSAGFGQEAAKVEGVEELRKKLVVDGVQFGWKKGKRMTLADLTPHKPLT